MKRTILLLMLALCILPAFNQAYIPSKGDVEKFFNTKTLVVLEDNNLYQYNAILKDVMNKEWTITEYDFIPASEFAEKRQDPSYSFLYVSRITFEKDKTDASYRFLCLSLGGNYYRLNEMPEIAAVPLSYYNVEEDSYAYKLNVLVRFIQNHALLVREKPEILSANVLNYYNNNTKEIKSRKLYLLKEELAPGIQTIEEIKKIYPFPFEIVDIEDIEEAIVRKDPTVVFLHKVGPEGTKLNARSYKIIMNAADASLYYFEYHKITSKNPDGLLQTDLKKLSK